MNYGGAARGFSRSTARRWRWEEAPLAANPARQPAARAPLTGGARRRSGSVCFQLCVCCVWLRVRVVAVRVRVVAVRVRQH